MPRSIRMYLKLKLKLLNEKVYLSSLENQNKIDTGQIWKMPQKCPKSIQNSFYQKIKISFQYMIYSFLHSFHETLQFKKLLNINIQSSNSWGSSNTWGSSNSSWWDHRIVGDHRIPLDLLSSYFHLKWTSNSTRSIRPIRASWKHPGKILQTSREHTLNLLWT